jgi:hypothetical protein
MNFSNPDSSIGNLGRNNNYSYQRFNNSNNMPTKSLQQTNYGNTECLTNQNLIQDNKGYICTQSPYYNENQLLIDNRFINPDVSIYSTGNNKIDERRDIKRENISTKNVTNQRIYGKDIEKYKQQLTVQDRVTRINIDSRHRNKTPINTYEENIYNLTNPITTIKDSNNIIINHINHPFRLEDKIAISNVQSTKVRLINPLEITKGIEYIKIRQPHNFFEGYDKYDDIYVEISGIKGNTRNYSFINNQIPIILLNKTHKIFFKRTETDDIDSNFYYIKIPITPLENYDDRLNSPFDNIVITEFINLNGIPLNLINADYPLNINRRQGFHIITNITANSYTINLRTRSIINQENIGGNIIIRKIIDSKEGFPDPNNYKISLKKTFRNVTKIQLISSEFPNTISQIVKFQESSPFSDNINTTRNDKLYWQNAEDGDYLYSIEIDSGNYIPQTLATHIENKIATIDRVNLITSVEDDPVNNKIINILQHKANIDINESTSVVSIRLFKEDIIRKNLTIEENPNDEDKPIIRINHKNHFLQVGDKIIISNALGTNGIESDIINREHEIIEVINKDNYKIILPTTNIYDNIGDTKGGVAVNILSPLHFRMFFDKDDTIGNLLGFRNVGDNSSITPFVTEVRNNIPYENSIPENDVGNIPPSRTDNYIQNGILNFNRIPYFILQSNISENSLTTGNITNILAKILVDGDKNEILYNTFVTLEREFEKPISEISNIEFTLLTPDGELVDFSNIDHSFTIEIIEKISNPTQYSSITGLI